ncbi:hypothetical protein M9435_001947 [Picochlorum sp. BPE23]|nr:hypothetical protein M9435_001947 [Picochlorum sp. BPE23]
MEILHCQSVVKRNPLFATNNATNPAVFRAPLSNGKTSMRLYSIINDNEAKNTAGMFVDEGGSEVVPRLDEAHDTRHVSMADEICLGGSSESNEGGDGMYPSTPSFGVRQVVREIQTLFVPRGWPESVTEDYLRYQLWTFPSHVFGWMSHSLAGSSMLKALGVGSGPVDSVGLSAAIKWVTKDGIGAAGRLFVGGKLGFMFDEDPKRWRMIAEAFTTLGLSLEIATQVSPSNFVILAGGGTVAKALGHGIGRPCFRVIQTHFALANNIGDVSAKEEVWETSAQLVGIAASVALLSGLETLGTPEAVVPAWFAVQAAHVAFRYYSLTVLSFPWPNFKRGSIIASHFITSRDMLDVNQASALEKMFESPTTLPHGTDCIFGSSWSEITRTWTLTNLEAIDVARMYESEKYILVIQEDVIHVILWVDAQGRDIMRAMLQACWIDAHKQSINDTQTLLRSSFESMRETFEYFEQTATNHGWDFERTIVPSQDSRLAMPTVD